MGFLVRYSPPLEFPEHRQSAPLTRCTTTPVRRVSNKLVTIGSETPTERLYKDIQAKKPQAVAHYLELKRKYEEGKRAQLVLDALQALHEQQKHIKASIGALPSGGCVTPSGHTLSQEALSRLVAACYAACQH